MSLATKYRPQTFDQVIGQNITSTILKHSVETGNVKNCYGFFGHSGCGKTTLAKCFATAINGEVIELDGGSAGNIDSIKAIIEEAKQRSVLAEYKVFIIDECQNLGGGSNKAAWGALLKCLEDCPKFTIFILCSTNPEKIPGAILNRLQRYNIAPISHTDIYNRLVEICKLENFTSYEQTCDLISRVCNNSMREAITMLDQCADLSTALDVNVASKIIGNVTHETLFNLTLALLTKNEASILDILDSVINSGYNLKTFVNTYLQFAIDLAKYCITSNINTTSIPAYLEQRCAGYSRVPDALDYANSLTEKLLELKSLTRFDTAINTTVVAYFIGMVR